MNKHDMNGAMLEAQHNRDDRNLALTIDELECLGYTVEALAHHPGLEGKFRWTNTHTCESQSFGSACDTETQAWARAAESWSDKHDSKGLLSAGHFGELTPAQLEGHYSRGGANGGGQHPLYTRADWRHAVGDGETVAGYWAWLATEISQRMRQNQGVRRAERQAGWLGGGH